MITTHHKVCSEVFLTPQSFPFRRTPVIHNSFFLSSGDCLGRRSLARRFVRYARLPSHSQVNIPFLPGHLSLVTSLISSPNHSLNHLRAGCA